MVNANAGFFKSQDVIQINRRRKYEQAHVAVNLRGCYLGLKSVGRAIRPQGAVVAMSSTAGLMGWDTNATYSATKHGIIGLVNRRPPPSPPSMRGSMRYVLA